MVTEKIFNYGYVGKARVVAMPKFKDRGYFCLFCLLAEDCIEAGVDNAKNIYFTALNGSTTRFSRADFRRKFHEYYNIATLSLKDGVRNNEVLRMPIQVHHEVRVRLINRHGFCYEDKIVEVSHLFSRWCGRWDGLQWTSCQYFLHYSVTEILKKYNLPYSVSIREMNGETIEF